MGRAVAVIGTGQTKHGRRDDLSYPDLVREAVKKVFEDAGITPKDVDGVVYGSMPSMMEGMAYNHFYFADALRVVGKPLLRTETCGSTGQSVAHTAIHWVASGMADVVLAVASEKEHEGDAQATMMTILEPFLQVVIGGAPLAFSLQSREWMGYYHIDDDKAREAASIVSVDSHDGGLKNPLAHIRVKLTKEDVSKAPIITYPVRLYDVCPVSDGACAVIFASEEKAKKICKKPAWVKGIGFRGEEYFIGDSNKAVWQSTIEASKEAYKEAGITNPLKELDVAEVYNPFSYQELMFLECLGLCPPGEAPDYVIKGTFSPGGELPCDPSGGVLCTNPIGAAGLIRVAEAALQVTGKAGEHQVEGAKLALSHAMGGAEQFNGITILGSEL
jgi:acetyl-CoA C-acetyltransferase